MTRNFIAAVGLGLLLAGASALPTADAADTKSELIGSQVEDFTLPRLTDGKDVTLSSYKGKVVIMSFWASWCGPCRKELPAYVETYKKYKDQGLEIVAISVDRDASDAKGFISQIGAEVPYTLLLDAESMVMGRYDIVSMPTSFVIGRDGRIVHREVGFSEDKLAEVEKILQKALETK